MSTYRIGQIFNLYSATAWFLKQFCQGAFFPWWIFSWVISITSCWHLAAAAAGSCFSRMAHINDLNITTTSCLAHHLHAKSIKKPTIPGGTSLEGGISSAFSNIINMKQEIANLLCFIFTCLHASQTTWVTGSQRRKVAKTIEVKVIYDLTSCVPAATLKN